VSNILNSLGIDPDRFLWQDLAACRGLDFNLFFDNYEENQTHARVIDEMCLHCPVIKDCYFSGTDNSETGVWGGIYLTNGVVDKSRNLHKTQENWEEVIKAVGFREGESYEEII
jgi:hypothetical protein